MSGAGAPRQSRIFHDLILTQGAILIISSSVVTNRPVATTMTLLF
jgi:hypothetical protein